MVSRHWPSGAVAAAGTCAVLVSAAAVAAVLDMPSSDRSVLTTRSLPLFSARSAEIVLSSAAFCEQCHEEDIGSCKKALRTPLHKEQLGRVGGSAVHLGRDRQ